MHKGFPAWGHTGSRGGTKSSQARTEPPGAVMVRGILDAALALRFLIHRTDIMKQQYPNPRSVPARSNCTYFQASLKTANDLHMLEQLSRPASLPVSFWLSSCCQTPATVQRGLDLCCFNIDMEQLARGRELLCAGPSGNLLLLSPME